MAKILTVRTTVVRLSMRNPFIKHGTQYYETSEYSQYVLSAHKNAAYEKPCGKGNK
jgi:hypothetical protein